MMPREQLRQIMEAINSANGVPIALGLEDVRDILNLADLAYEAQTLMGEIVVHIRAGQHGYAIGVIKAWLDTNVAPQAPCIDQSGFVPSPGDAIAPSHPSEVASHKEGSTPAAATSGPPGKISDGPRLPAQPADATPLERHERVCADKLAATAEAMVNSFRDHLDKCQACRINWQSMKKALGEYQGCTR